MADVADAGVIAGGIAHARLPLRRIRENARMYDAVSNTAEVVAAVLGIAVTVVAIIVQLAATRFNHRISTLFAREPVNILVLSFFVLTAVLCVWVSATTSEGSHPDLHRFVMVMVTLSLLALLPYFA